MSTATKGYSIDQITVGQSASSHNTVSESDIQKFAEVSGDHNPVHMDEAYASKTMFKGRIAHGMLSAAYISSVLGNQLPGPGCIYMSQSMKFKAPVKIGDTVDTVVTVREIIPEKKRLILDTVCRVGDTVVVEGEAMLMIP
jgi:3-hydroxybutyryl-CoA dehydratase